MKVKRSPAGYSERKKSEQLVHCFNFISSPLLHFVRTFLLQALTPQFLIWLYFCFQDVLEVKVYVSKIVIAYDIILYFGWI